MDSKWNSASFAAGTLQCLLCRKSLNYNNGDRSEFINHLKNVHSAKIHHNLILAVTFLENKTINKIISQFENHSKTFQKQKVDTDEDWVVEEMDVEEDINDIVEVLEKNDDKDDDNDISVLEIVEENNDPVEIIEQPELEENVGTENKAKGIDYDEIIENSEYFKNNPKLMTTSLNPDLHSGDLFPLVDPNLPSGWKVRDHKTKSGELEKHYLAPDGRVIKSKRAVIEYMKIMEKYSVQNIINISKSEEPQEVFGDLWNHLSSNETPPSQSVGLKSGKRGRTENFVSRELSFGKKPEPVRELRRKSEIDQTTSFQSDGVKNERRRRSENIVSKELSFRRKSEPAIEVKGKGKECPECHKVVSMLEKHIEDMHSPPGHFPCRGCGKVFTSKNKEGSHYSRHCNPNRKK